MDKKLINRATSNNEDPTPGYFFKEIIEMTFLDISSVQTLVKFLMSKITYSIDKELSFSLIKTLKIIRQLCLHGHEEFQNMMTTHVDEIRDAVSYTGGLSHVDGNAVRKTVKNCAREAIEAIFATQKHRNLSSTASTEKPVIHDLSNATISKMYNQQHAKSMYIAPTVPLGKKSEVLDSKLHDVEIDITQKTLPSREELKNAIQLTQELINWDNELESPALVRFYENCVALENDSLDGKIWEHVSTTLNEALSIGRRWKAKYNAATIIEFLMRKNTKIVSMFFSRNTKNLIESHNGVHFLLRRKSRKILEMISASKISGLPEQHSPELILSDDKKTNTPTRHSWNQLSSSIDELFVVAPMNFLEISQPKDSSNDLESPFSDLQDL